MEANLLIHSDPIAPEPSKIDWVGPTFWVDIQGETELWKQVPILNELYATTGSAKNVVFSEISTLELLNGRAIIVR